MGVATRFIKEKLAYLSVPADAAPVYRAYMRKRGIQFKERWIDKKRRRFTISRRLRPHQWKLDLT